MKNPPAFQFYPKDFLSDFNVMLMSMEEVGMYITLLCFCWMEGQLPNDIPALAKLCRCNESDMANAWQAHISRCFTLSECGGFYYHGRLRAERDKQIANSIKKSANGKKGADARYSVANAKDLPKPCHDFASANGMAESSSPISILHIAHSSESATADAPKSKARPQSLADVLEYFTEIKSTHSEAEKFFDHFTANGWKQGGKAAMKDWKAAARNWARRSAEFTGKQNGSTQSRFKEFK